jgi:hypothetical protein
MTGAEPCWAHTLPAAGDTAELPAILCTEKTTPTAQPSTGHGASHRVVCHLLACLEPGITWSFSTVIIMHHVKPWQCSLLMPALHCCAGPAQSVTAWPVERWNQDLAVFYTSDCVASSAEQLVAVKCSPVEHPRQRLLHPARSWHLLSHCP